MQQGKKKKSRVLIRFRDLQKSRSTFNGTFQGPSPLV